MAKKTMQTDIVAARASAEPGSYAARYQFDVASGRVMPRTPDGQMPAALRKVQFTLNKDNTLDAYVPALAGGAAQVGMMMQFMDGGWTPDTFGNWDSVNFNTNDGKDEIRKAIAWWRKDPLVFRCQKVLAQLSNSRITVICEDDDFKTLVENWMASAVNYSFRKAWFTEYWRTSMVPVLKTLIPYKPRDYKSGKTPQTTDGNIESAQAAKTQEIVDRNDQAYRAMVATA
jgi:hypothetical protein